MFIPKKIKVGYQNRSDTYTGRLAYVIYYDEKSKLRKESSWKSWTKEPLGSNDYPNEPTSGFVLNKKVGDYVSDWNHRSAYVRVFDPRNFEFEITVENLLFILENTSSIKGKGLEGDFVYGWSGTDLMLIPTACPDYQKIYAYSEMITNPEKFNKDNMIVGATYITKDSDEWVYMGRYDKYFYTPYSWGKRKFPNGYNLGKYYFFTMKNTYTGKDRVIHYATRDLKTVGSKIVKIKDVTPVSDYAERFEALQANIEFSPLDIEATIITPLTLEQFKSKVNNSNGWDNILIIGSNGEPETISIKPDSNRSYNWKTNTYDYETETTYSSDQSCVSFTFSRLTPEKAFELVKPVKVRRFLKTGKEVHLYGN